MQQNGQGAVYQNLANALPDSRINGFCGLLKVLSNPNRLRILSYLLHQEASVGDLESTLPLKQPNLSHELRKLRDQKLVITRRQSKVIFYSIANEISRDMIAKVLHLLHPEPLPAAEPETAEYQATGRAAGGTKNGECSHFAVVA